MIRGNLSLKFNSKEFKDAGEDFCFDFATVAIERVQDVAMHNVSPGVGPGPHPHKPPPMPQHEDTGNLMASVKTAVKRQGNGVSARFWTDEDYGMDLEIGWTTPAGNFYRYPWMRPAFDIVMNDIPRGAMRLNMQGKGGRFIKSGGRVG